MAKDTVQTLREEIERLKAMLGVGAAPMTGKVEDRADYIAYGSPEHAAFLGLMEVEDAAEAKEAGSIVHTSLATGNSYQLGDQVTAFMRYPDPMKIAQLVLTQKVSALESGEPKAPPNAPSLWLPREQFYAASMVA